MKVLISFAMPSLNPNTYKRAKDNTIQFIIPSSAIVLSVT